MKPVSKDKKNNNKQIVEENHKRKIGIIGFLKTNWYSIQGLFNYFKNETSAFRYFYAWLIQLFLFYKCKPSGMEIIIISICMTLILAIELLNTAIESICDLVSPEYNKYVKIAKDSASAASYIFSWVTGIISLVIYLT